MVVCGRVVSVAVRGITISDIIKSITSPNLVVSGAVLFLQFDYSITRNMLPSAGISHLMSDIRSAPGNLVT